MRILPTVHGHRCADTCIPMSVLGTWSHQRPVSRPQWLCWQYVAPHHRTVQCVQWYRDHNDCVRNMLHHTTGLFSACNGIATTMTVFAICYTTPPDCSVQWYHDHNDCVRNMLHHTTGLFSAIVSRPQWLCSQHVAPHHRTVQCVQWYHNHNDCVRNMLHHTTGLFSACNGITTTMTVFATCYTTPPDCSVRVMVSQPQWLCSQHVTPHHRTV